MRTNPWEHRMRAYPIIGVVAALSAATGCVPTVDEGDTAAEATAPTQPSEPPTSPARSCDAGPEDLGAWYGILDPAVVEPEPLDEDAGITAVAAEMPAEDYGYATIDLLVDGAVVTLVGDDPTRNFWLEDGAMAIRVALDVPLEAAPAPGDVVVVAVGSIRNVQGQPNISRIDTLAVRASDAGVPVRESGVIDHTVEGAAVHHAYGTITERLTGCSGGVTCYAFEAAGRGTLELRVPSGMMLVAGDCVETVTPIGYAGGQSFLEVDLWDQLRWY